MIKESAIFTLENLNADIWIETYESPIGNLVIGASEVGLVFIKLWKDVLPNPKPNEITTLAIKELQEYFSSNVRTFSVPLDWSSHTDFSKKVWAQLINIPYGTTISYLKLAQNLGDPKCIRAAASANGRNPLPIIVPCHRVIGSDGSLTGFAMGLEVKLSLLALENPAKYNIKQTVLAF